MDQLTHQGVPPGVTQTVDRVFCSPTSARYGPYVRQDDGSVVAPGVMYRYKVLNTADQPLALQVFTGLGRLGGPLWEQEVRVLLRVSATSHPALPRIVDGGFENAADIAFVVTERANYTGDDPGVLPVLQSRRPECVRHLGMLADSLSVLHGQGLMHRNLWPGTVELLDPRGDQSVLQLRLSRFEMSALISNLMRDVGADPQAAAVGARELFLSQGRRALACFPPERLALLLGSSGADTVETDRSDVFSLGVIAWEWFIGTLPVDEFVTADAGEEVREQIESLHRHMRAELQRAPLPRPLRDLLEGMLRHDTRTRSTSAEVAEAVSRRYDALVAAWETDMGHRPHGIAFMPAQSSRTVYAWGWIGNDPATTDAGRQELRAFLEDELRGATLVYSARGAEDFVRDPDTRALNDARLVLLGRRGAWFCVVYRRSGGFGVLGEEDDRLLLIKYVTPRERAYALERQAFRRRISSADVMPFDIGDDALDARSEGRPSWQPLIDAVKSSMRRPDWEETFDRATAWLLDLETVETRSREYAFERVSDDGHADYVRLKFDRARDSRRIQRHTTGMFAMLAGSTRASFGDFFGELQGEEGAGGLLQYREDDDGWPGRGADGRAYWARRLDDELIEIRRSRESPEVPVRGWIRPLDDAGSDSNLRRQAEARVELLATPGLLGQLHSPTTVQGLRHRWRRAGRGLRGGGDEIVKDMLVSQPFFALHGPPGTGKTTVVAAAVQDFVRLERSARVLVSAQSNHALDNLALKLLRALENAGIRDILAVRVAGRSDDRVREEMKRYLLEPQTRALAERIKNACDDRLANGGDVTAVRALLEQWRAGIDGSVLELQDRLRRGANLVFATCVGATKRNVDAVGGFGVYDWVFVEEAARAWPTELALPLVRGVRWTLIGDHRQLPAHRREEVDEVLMRCASSDDEELAKAGQERDQYRTVFDLFGGLFVDDGRLAPSPSLRPPIGRLKRQFRMRGPIAEVVSRAFYKDDGGLETDESAEVSSGIVAPPALAEPAVIWLDTAGLPGVGDEERWRNRGEADFIAKLVGAIRPREVLLDSRDPEEPSLAVLTPWRHQADALRSALGDELSHTVHTVPAFQGRQARIVILSLVRDRVRGESAMRRLGFAVRPELVNVMFSRARRLLVVVGNHQHFAESGVDFWQVISSTVGEVGVVLPATDLEL